MNIKYDFTGKTAFVTGGSGVLCSEIGRALCRAGANVVFLANSNLDKAGKTADDLNNQGFNAAALSCNVLDKESIEKAVQETVKLYGAIDILINGAGGARAAATTDADRSFFSLEKDDLQFVFDLNLMGILLPSQIIGKIMVEQGSGKILNISSMGAVRPLTRSVAYSAAKAAVTNFTQWLAVHFAQEYSDAVIRVNALVPGFFLTAQNEFLLKKGDELTARGKRIIDHTPLGKFGRPEDLCGPALFLLSDEADFVHGETLVVDGGLNAYGGI